MKVVDLEAVARVATAKWEKYLADVKVQNNRVAWKKQERADHLKKQKEDEEAVEVNEEEGGRGSQEKGSGATSSEFCFACLLGARN